MFVGEAEFLFSGHGQSECAALLLEQIQVAADSSLADAQARHQFDVTVLACKTA